MLMTLAATAPPPAQWSWAWWLDLFGTVGGKTLTILIIVVAAVLTSWLLRIVIRRVVARIVNGAKTKASVDDTQALDRSPIAAVRLVQRTRTLGSILQNIVNVILGIVAIVLIVNTIDSTILGSFALLSAALGAGLGFGAQNIVKDVLNGIFIVAEDQLGIGDVVDMGLATGVVEYVSVRITHVRDANGTLWYVRNGEVSRIGNMSQGWSRVIIDLAVPTDADLTAVEKAMLTSARDLAREAKWRTRILQQPEIWGLESISGDALVIRLVMKTRPNAKDDVARELRARLKTAIDSLGVRLPSLTSIVLEGADGAMSVGGAHPPKTKPTPVTPAALDERPIWRPRRISRKRPSGADDAGNGSTDGAHRPSASTIAPDDAHPSITKPRAEKTPKPHDGTSTSDDASKASE